MSDPYEAIAERLGGRLIGRSALTGGVSADVQALELARPDGRPTRVVVRRHQVDGWKPLEAGVTGTEHALMSALAATGLPVPRPMLLDLSGEVLPAPYLVLPFVEGTTVVPAEAASARLEPMARFLARLHALDPAPLIPPGLPPRFQPVPELLEWLPDDPSLDPVRARLAALEPLEPAEPAVLHGDFWPGNILWQGDQIAAVIDWEDAAVGDVHADLATCRLELLWAFGWSLPERFLTLYRVAGGRLVEPHRLSLWEAYVAAAVLKFMGLWGLEPADEARKRVLARGFLDRAAGRLSRLR